MKTALTIAGRNCTGGAGIQTDWKTGNGEYAMPAITARNATGVSRICAKAMESLSDAFV